MAGGAGAGADGGAGGGGGGDGRGPSGGSSSGGRSLRGELSLGVSEAESRGCARRGARRPGKEGAVPGRWGYRVGAGTPRGAPGRRRGEGNRPSGAEAAADRPVPVRSQGQTRLCAVVPGAEARGVALGAGRAARGGRDSSPAGSGLQGAEPAAPRTPGNRSRDSGACLPGCGAATAPGWA